MIKALEYEGYMPVCVRPVTKGCNTRLVLWHWFDYLYYDELNRPNPLIATQTKIMSGCIAYWINFYLTDFCNSLYEN